MSEHPPIGALTSKDAAWIPVAKQFREAVRIVRPDVTRECLPGEPDACGEPAVRHVLASAALLAAVGLHHAEHAGPGAVTDFWDILDAHRLTLSRHHGGECDCGTDKAGG